MTVADAQTELAALRAARLRILSGGVASYAINGRQATYLSLKDLDAREAVLQSIIATNGRSVAVAAFRTPS